MRKFRAANQFSTAGLGGTRPGAAERHPSQCIFRAARASVGENWRGRKNDSGEGRMMDGGKGKARQRTKKGAYLNSTRPQPLDRPLSS